MHKLLVYDFWWSIHMKFQSGVKILKGFEIFDMNTLSRILNELSIVNVDLQIEEIKKWQKIKVQTMFFHIFFPKFVVASFLICAQ